MIFEGQVPASKPRIYYGEKVHFLCTRSGVADIRVAMTEMQQVVCLMLDRLEADLATDEVAISMAAFRVLSWLDKSKENLLRKHVAVLGKVLKLPRDGSSEFARVAKTLANLVQTCKTQQICVNHRVVWSWVLVPQWRSKFLPGAIEISKELEAMIFFSWAWRSTPPHWNATWASYAGKWVPMLAVQKTAAWLLLCWRWPWMARREKKTSLKESKLAGNQSSRPQSLGAPAPDYG